MSNLLKYQDLPLKKYYIVRFNFQPGFDRYEVFEYEAKRTKTIKQMWQQVYADENAFMYSGHADHIMQFNDILKKYNLPEKRSYWLMSFGRI